jgi:hypothetical protein
VKAEEFNNNITNEFFCLKERFESPRGRNDNALFIPLPPTHTGRNGFCPLNKQEYRDSGKGGGGKKLKLFIVGQNIVYNGYRVAFNPLYLVFSGPKEGSGVKINITVFN